MHYEVIVEKRSLKDLKRLPDAVKKKIAKILLELEEYTIPAHRYDVKKLRGERNTYRIRVGKYRLIYEIVDNNIHILPVSQRKKAYKK